MKFDTIIIGGGLSGLACGISLAEHGKRCAIISSGQGALHFFSGSLDLLGYDEEKEVKNPLEALVSLHSEHPYSLVGVENLKAISAQVPDFLKKVGANVIGNNAENHYRLTPIGNLRPTWLTLDEYFTIEDAESLKSKKVLLLNIAGFLDMPVKFVATGLEKLGVSCEISEISLPELDNRRENASEMRSVNIAKVIETVGVEKVAEKINNKYKNYDIVLVPAVFGWNGNEQAEKLQQLTDCKIKLVATLPPSTPGVRLQGLLCKYFQSLGGTILSGDTVESGLIENGKLQWVTTHNLEDERLTADNFVLATGNFFSHGIAGAPNKVYEPIFGLDVNAKTNRGEWYKEQFFEEQPYMRFGVATDSTFKVRKDGKIVENMYVAGSVLSGANQIKEACMGGVSIITGLHVAGLINKL